MRSTRKQKAMKVYHRKLYRRILKLETQQEILRELHPNKYDLIWEELTKFCDMYYVDLFAHSTIDPWLLSIDVFR